MRKTFGTSHRVFGLPGVDAVSNRGQPGPEVPGGPDERVFPPLDDQRALPRHHRQNLAERCGGLVFPIRRLHQELRDSTRRRVAMDSAVYLASSIESLSKEVFSLAVNTAQNYNREEVSHTDVIMTFKENEDLHHLTKNVVFPS